jgi:hypothetical protein
MASTTGLPTLPLEPRLVPTAHLWLSDRFPNDEEEQVTRLEEAASLQMAALRALRAPLPQGVDVYASKQVESKQRSGAGDYRRSTPYSQRMTRARPRRRPQASGLVNTAVEREPVASDPGDNDLDEDDEEGAEPQSACMAGADPLRSLVLPRYELPHHAVIYGQTDWFRERQRLAMEAPRLSSAAVGLNLSSRPHVVQDLSTTSASDRHRLDIQNPERLVRERSRYSRYADLSTADLDDTLVTALFQHDMSDVVASTEAAPSMDQRGNGGLVLSSQSDAHWSPLLAFREEPGPEQPGSAASGGGRHAFGDSIGADRRYRQRRSAMFPDETLEDTSPWHWPRLGRFDSASRGGDARGPRRDAYAPHPDRHWPDTVTSSVNVDVLRTEVPSIGLSPESANRQQHWADMMHSFELERPSALRRGAQSVPGRSVGRASPATGSRALNWSPAVGTVTRRYMAAMMDGVTERTRPRGSHQATSSALLEPRMESTSRMTERTTAPSPDNASRATGELVGRLSNGSGLFSSSDRAFRDRLITGPSAAATSRSLHIPSSSGHEDQNHSGMYERTSTLERTPTAGRDWRLTRASGPQPPVTDSILHFRAWERLATGTSSSFRDSRHVDRAMPQPNTDATFERNYETPP